MQQTIKREQIGFDLLDDAPSDGKSYIRKNGAWEEVTPGDVSPVYPVEVIAYDLFAGADGTSLPDHSMVIGSGWSALVGSITLASNTAQCQSATSAAVTECGRPDITISVNIQCGAATANHAPSIICRAYDNSNYIQLYFAGNGVFEVYRKLSGSLTLFNTGASWPADTSSHSISVVCEDTHYIVYCDGELIWDGYIPSLAAATKFGILGFVSGGNKDSFDNFQVTGKQNEVAFPGDFVTNSFTDTFTGATGTSLSENGWTLDVGTWQIYSNNATQTLTSSPANGYVVSRDIGITDYGLEAQFITPASGHFICGLVFRMVDKNHYIEAEFNTGAGGQGGFGVWYTDNSGSYKELARQDIGAFTPAANTTYTMRIRVDGQLIIAEVVEPALKIICRSSMFPNATKVGLFEFRNGTYVNPNKYDNFKVYNA